MLYRLYIVANGNAVYLDSTSFTIVYIIKSAIERLDNAAVATWIERIK